MNREALRAALRNPFLKLVGLGYLLLMASVPAWQLVADGQGSLPAMAIVWTGSTLLGWQVRDGALRGLATPPSRLRARGGDDRAWTYTPTAARPVEPDPVDRRGRMRILDGCADWVIAGSRGEQIICPTGFTPGMDPVSMHAADILAVVLYLGARTDATEATLTAWITTGDLTMLERVMRRYGEAKAYARLKGLKSLSADSIARSWDVIRDTLAPSRRAP